MRCWCARRNFWSESKIERPSSDHCGFQYLKLINHASITPHRRWHGPNEAWVIGGDFNSSETFDFGPGGPRGNKEHLDHMAELGLTECLRKSRGKLAPTFRHSRGSIQHQIDHLFVTKCLADKLQSCDVGVQEEIFGANPRLSDHLPIIADFNI